MKHSFSFIAILFIVLGFTFFLLAWISPPPPSKTAEKLPGFAVVELFTSQGCSSCPPADAVLRKIAQRAQLEDIPVYVLSFHVDYWDRLGWKDPFSQSHATQRQRQYVRTWKDSQMYTPQMTVNGRTGFVGSRQQQAWQEIETSLKQSADASIELQADVLRDQITLAYQISGDYTKKHLQIALVEKDIETSVRRGENGGKKLKHTHVVREFASQPLSHSNASGTVTLPLPTDLNPNNTLIIAYVQDDTHHKISAAASYSLGNM